MGGGRYVEAMMAGLRKQCEELNLRLPRTPTQYQKVRKGWKKVDLKGSARRYFKGVVSALDGWVCAIKKPTAKSNSVKGKGVPDQVSYFNGHYGVDAFNVQAMCDSKKRFMFVSAEFAGSVHDSKAYRLGKLKKWVDSLPVTGLLTMKTRYKK
eukprot:Nk52_evm32s914 gene=Nk52_evmTU32s914